MAEPMISGGWYVVRWLERPAGLGGALLPERLLTLSSCLASFFPDAWAIEWARYSVDERAASARKLGIDRERLPELVRAMTSALTSGELGWPSVWRSLEAARRAAAAFGCDNDDFALVELGVPAERAEALVAHTRPTRGARPTGFFACLDARAPLHEGGALAGWELLGVEAGVNFHSWLCNSLHDAASAKLGVKPGPFGLLGSERDALAVDRLVASGVGAEPVPWFPGILVRHDFATKRGI